VQEPVNGPGQCVRSRFQRPVGGGFHPGSARLVVLGRPRRELEARQRGGQPGDLSERLRGVAAERGQPDAVPAPSVVDLAGYHRRVAQHLG
jgi:hypothetical protein